MKKFKGFINVYSAVIIIFFILVVSLFASYSFSGNNFTNFLAHFKKQPKVEVKHSYLSNNRTAANYVSTFPVQSIAADKKNISIEGMVKQNLANDTYVQTSGSSGINKNVEQKEISQVMNAYAVQIVGIIPSSAGWFDNSSPERSINVYNNLKSDLDNFVTATDYTNKTFSNVAQKNQLLTNMALVNMVIYFNTVNKNNKTPLDSLSNDLEAYNKALPAGEYKTFINDKVGSLIDFSKNLKYSIDPSLYQEKLGQTKNNTIMQDQALVDRMFTDVNSYSETQKRDYAARIGILPVKTDPSTSNS